MGDSNNTSSIADYLAQLLKDKKQLAAFPSVFLHVERLLDEGSNSLLVVLRPEMKIPSDCEVPTTSVAKEEQSGDVKMLWDE
ncbi:hypothetical protein Pcinc_016401 [Petrolisthes cinctipes]|uniref:STAR protein homodimerisation region domain-containing protein n=1 Tax=Petrolisthes cinctipes TaxID=88211 RepID=A0AAE1KNT8_PETCI|nr:hypothetical protein Pcinc_016401 [Petrolisthes cinctipes]